MQVTSTTSRLFSGVPLLLYFMTELFSSEHSRNAIVNVLCKYMPGAVFDKESHLPMSIYKGEWQNCTTPENLSNLRPNHVYTGSETMLELYIVNFVSNELAHKVATFRVLEVSVMSITIQVFQNLCSIHMDDVVSMQVSREEFILWIINYMCFMYGTFSTVFLYGTIFIFYRYVFNCMSIVVDYYNVLCFHHCIL